MKYTYIPTGIKAELVCEWSNNEPLPVATYTRSHVMPSLLHVYIHSCYLPSLTKTSTSVEKSHYFLCALSSGNLFIVLERVTIPIILFYAINQKLKLHMVFQNVSKDSKI